MISVRAPVPVSVSMFGLHAALRERNALAGVAAALLSSNSPLIVLGWQKLSEIRRDSLLVSEMAAKMGWTQNEVDDVFRRAARIVI